MDFGMTPPEINSGRMYCGPGSGSMVEAAVAWQERGDGGRRRNHRPTCRGLTRKPIRCRLRAQVACRVDGEDGR